MPIYAYKCESCGHAKDVLQKMSDALLTDCPQCGAPVFKKQLTAAGFQLKGSGWYVTDFRDGKPSGTPAAESSGDAKSGESAPVAATPSAATATSPAAGSTAAAPSPAPAPAPAAAPAAPKANS